jgi:hypothetical protein
MRILLFLAVFTVLFPLVGQAQEAGSPNRKYYNTPDFNGGTGGIYVAPTTNAAYTPAAPILLKQMLEGRDSTALPGSPQSYYGGVNMRPYDGQNTYSLALSPQQIRATQEKRNAELRNEQRRQELEAQKLAKSEAAQRRSEESSRQFEQRAYEPAAAVRETPRVIYNKPELGGTAKRVFNTTY